MWLLLVITCLGSETGPHCRSDLDPVVHIRFAACEDAAMRADAMERALAVRRDQSVLLLETRCLNLGAFGTPVRAAP